MREHLKDYTNPKPGFGTPLEALFAGFSRIPEIEVHVISCTQEPLSSPPKLTDNIFLHCLHVPKIGWMRTGYQGCIRATRKKLREIQPDIVHGQGTERDCAISAALSGFPNVLTIHGCMNAIAQLHKSRIGSFHWLAARLEDFALSRTNGVLCISDYVQALVGKYNVKTWLIPNAIQAMFFDFPKELAQPKDKPLLINVGVISERKRQLELLAVLTGLRQDGLQFNSLFVGVAPPKTAYTDKFIEQLNLAKSKFGGFEHIQRLDDASFCRLFDQASAMIHFSNEESFGLTFAEAIARGLYLFASDVGAIHDIARGVGRVQIINPDDWNRLKTALRQWLVTETYKAPRPEKPPAEFYQNYHPNYVAQKHLAVYREVLGKT